MIHTDTQRLSTTPWFTWDSIRCNQHTQRYGDRDYNHYLDSGNWCDRDLYVIPISHVWTSPHSGIPDDYVYQLPPEVLEAIKNRTLYLLWDMSTELYSPDMMHKLFVRDTPWAMRAQQFVENTLTKYAIPKDHTGLLTGNIMWQQVHSPWYETLTVNWHEQIWSYKTDRNYHNLNMLKYQEAEARPRKILTHLGMIRDHKLELAHHINHNHDISDCVLTITGHPSEIERLRSELESASGETCDLTMPTQSDLSDYPDWGQRVTQHWVSDNCYMGYNKQLKADYLNSAVELCVDTIVQDTQLTLDCNQTGDRPFRSFAMAKPFIYAGPHMGISYLRELGYKTFHEFWDESYDVLPDWRDRMHEVKRNIDRLLRASPREIAMLCQQMTDILQHNHENYVNNSESQRHLRHLNRERYL